MRVRPSTEERVPKSARATSLHALATGAIVGAARTEDDAADRRFTDGAGLAFAAVNLVVLLEAAAAAFGVDIVRNRRAFQFDGGSQDSDHRFMQAGGALGAQAGCDRFGVNAGLEQRLVGVDVPHAAHE